MEEPERAQHMTIVKLQQQLFQQEIHFCYTVHGLLISAPL